MSYGLRIAADAIADLRTLEPWLQEVVLDELERLTENAPSLRLDRFGEAVFDFERLGDPLRHTVFLRLHRDDSRHILTLLGVGHHPQPL